jgi:hypothetical protein
MKHILVPLLTAADLTNLEALVAYLKSLQPASVVILHNPSLGVSAENVTNEVDQQIRDLEKAKNDAKERDDFPAAARFVDEIEAAKMKRADVLRDGWQSVPAEERERAYRNFVVPFVKLDPAYVEQITLSEDTTHENLLVTLANMGKTWPACLPHGRWSLIPASDVPAAASAPAPAPVPTAAPDPKAEKKAAEIPTDAAGRADYYRRFYMSMKKAAKDLGVPIDGRPKEEVIADIINKEFPVAA